MTFAKRKIKVQLALSGDTFDGSNNTVTLEGLRCFVTAQSTIGGATPYFGLAQVALYGMHGDDMAKLSTLGLTTGTYKRNAMRIYAGDDIAGMAMIFDGAINGAFVDYNAMPDVSVQIMASSTQGLQLPKIAASSYKGTLDVATMIQAIATDAGYTVVNAGVKAVLANHAVAGDAMAQISDICLASLTHWDVQGKVITIWPYGATRDADIITVDPSSGLVGYPMYSVQGIDITTQFNPNILLGRQVSVKSTIPPPGPNAPFNTAGITPIGATGTFYTFNVVHEISAEYPNGPWFTHTQLGTINTQVRAS